MKKTNKVLFSTFSIPRFTLECSERFGRWKRQTSCNFWRCEKIA